MNDKRLTAFPPILKGKPKVLILGTMPGGKSLERQQYYAHPQNQFWRLMGDIYGAKASLPYDERLKILYAAGVAVWDVLHSCERVGSMDADIKNVEVNNFEQFFRKHKSIQRVVFDSATAEHYYRRRALPTLTIDLEYRRVPSPSPAHARMRYEEKLSLWREALVTDS